MVPWNPLNNHEVDRNHQKWSNFFVDFQMKNYFDKGISKIPRTATVIVK